MLGYAHMINKKTVSLPVLMIVRISLNTCDFFYNLAYSPATIEFINESNLSVVKIYITLQSDPDWGENHISSPLEPNSSASIQGIEKDIVKIKIIFENDID